MALSEEQKEIALGDFDKWHKEHAKYMEPADIVHWCREAWESSRASLPKPWPVAWANMQEDGVTPCLLSISQHPEDRANWLNPVPLYTGNTLITQPDHFTQRDALLDALKEALECGEDGDWQSARRVLVAAIASVKGGE